LPVEADEHGAVQGGGTCAGVHRHSEVDDAARRSIGGQVSAGDPPLPSRRRQDESNGQAEQETARRRSSHSGEPDHPRETRLACSGSTTALAVMRRPPAPSRKPFHYLSDPNLASSPSRVSSPSRPGSAFSSACKPGVSSPPPSATSSSRAGDGLIGQAGNGAGGEVLVEAFPGGTQDPLDAARSRRLDALDATPGY